MLRYSKRVISAFLLSFVSALAAADVGELTTAEALRFLASPEGYIRSLDCQRAYKSSKTPEGALVAAVECGETDGVIRLLDAGVGANSLVPNDPKKRTVLFRAVARMGNEAIVSVLLSHGAGIDQRASDGSTPLETASWWGHAAMVKLLLANKADPNISGFHGGPLHAAVSGGHLEVVELLLKAGADPNLKIPTIGVAPGATPLHRHSWRGISTTFPAILNVFIKHGANVNAKTDNGQTPLENAERNSFLPLVRAGAIARSGSLADIESLAVQKGAADALDYLLSSNAVPNSPEQLTSLLRQAVTSYWQYDESVPLLLLRRGAQANDPDRNGWTPFELAVNNCYRKTVTYILRFAKPNHIDLAKMLRQRGERHRSVSENVCANIVQDLVNSGADVNGSDSNGQSVLVASIARGSVLNTLLKNGAVANAIDKDGRNVLHYLAEGGYWQDVDRLIAAGANPNLPDKDGDTPLHRVIAEGRNIYQGPEALAQALITGGARTDLKNRAGETPLDVARRIEWGGRFNVPALLNILSGTTFREAGVK